jgi:hypothetical protein
MTLRLTDSVSIPGLYFVFALFTRNAGRVFIVYTFRDLLVPGLDIFVTYHGPSVFLPYPLFSIFWKYILSPVGLHHNPSREIRKITIVQAYLSVGCRLHVFLT